MINLKKQLYDWCLNYAESRIITSRNAIQAAREAAEGDSKSSAGDKYETTREMMQQEIDRNRVQLAEAEKLKHVMQRISPDRATDSVQPGSLVRTDKGLFYLAIGAGQLKLDEHTVYALSPSSPLGRLLTGKKATYEAVLNGSVYRIEAVY